MSMLRIDLNSDMGESFGAWSLGADAEMMALVSSANIACGFHAGDPQVMQTTVRLAKQHRVGVGAHPGYPDLVGFGRRSLAMSAEEVEASVLYQIAALAGMAKAEGVALVHVKAHGALYNDAATHRPLAAAIARAIARFDPKLILVGLAGSELLQAGAAAGLHVASEVFADRAYNADGTLRSRRLPGAMILDPERAAQQVIQMIQNGYVTTYESTQLSIQVDTVCLHGDTPGAPAIAAAVRRQLEAAGIQIVGMAP